MAPRKPRTGPPDFIGVGTQRSGTTWWFMSLLEHPQIRAPRSGKKELHYLSWFATHELKDEHIARYHRKFPRVPGELVGEWTPRYMHDFWTARAIRRAAPDAKLLVMLRDPIERFRSGVAKTMRSARNDQPLDRVMAESIERGRYATQLRHVRRELPDARILVLQYEKCARDPVAQYRRTLEFLGADVDLPTPDFARPRGRSQSRRKMDLWPDMVAALQATLEPEVAQLAEDEPEIDVRLWVNFAHLAGASAALQG